MHNNQSPIHISSNHPTKLHLIIDISNIIINISTIWFAATPTIQKPVNISTIQVPTTTTTTTWVPTTPTPIKG
jgi:hypothetical protein